MLCLVAGFANSRSLAGSSLLAVYQEPEYPAPGQSYAYPPGLLFEVCTDGSTYRSSNGGAERGTASESVLRGLQTNIEKEWLGSLRAECRARGVVVDMASIRVEPSAGDWFQCTLYDEGEALKQFEARIAALHLSNVTPSEQRLSSICK